jgi:gamma-glutamyltranspeptidase/glutathione hydrolase
LHAWALARGGDITLGATPGGVNQLPWNAQLLRELLRGIDLAAAVTSPRWALGADDVLTAEEGADTGDADPASRVAPFSLRSAQQVLKIGSDGLHTAAADPRAGAAALALY